MTRAKDISKIVTDADLSGTLDVAGELQVGVDGTTAGLIRLMDSGSVTEEATISTDANGGLIFGGNSGPGELIFRTGSSTKRMDIDSGGDISFYEDTGTTPKLFWDASAEELRIGTTSSLTSSGKLTVQGSSGDDQYLSYIKNTNTSLGQGLIVRVDHSNNRDILNANANGTTVFTAKANGNVGIGTSSPVSAITTGTKAALSATAQINPASSEVFASFSPTQTGSTVFNVGNSEYLDGSNRTFLVLRSNQGSNGTSCGEYIESFRDTTAGSTANYMAFGSMIRGASTATPTERMRIDSSGNLLVGKTASGSANVGGEIRPTGAILTTADGGFAAVFNRETSDGEIVRIKKDDVTVGSIGNTSGQSYFYIANDGGCGIAFGNANAFPANGTGALSDNTKDLGGGATRWDDVYATNGTIQTSDRNEKQDIEELSEAEQRVAVVAKGLMRKFRWIDSVAEKGDNARTHFGVIAQDLQDAFTAEGLDASKYAMFTSNTWWEKEISVDAVEADEENGIEAKDAYTYIDTKEEATEGYTERTRLGVRYNQLLAFIISAI